MNHTPSALLSCRAMDPRPDPDRTRPDGGRTAVTIAEAARRLGVSTDAVRKRLHRGTLAGAKVAGEWRVWLPVGRGSDTTDRPDPRPDATGPGPDADRTGDRTLVEALIAGKDAEIAYLRDRLEDALRQLTAERERFDVLMREALARIPALGAGETATAAPSAPPQPPRRAEDAEPAEDAPGVWRRLWRALGGR